MNGRRWMLRAVVVGLAVALVPAGCGAGGDTERDSEAAVPEWRAEPDVRIEGSDVLLTTVGAVRIGSAGELLVSQPQDQRVLVFDTDGQQRATLGGPGEGPGEIRSLTGFGLVGDTVFIADMGLQGVSYFKGDGAFLSSRRWMLDIEMARGADGAISYPAPPNVILSDGTALARPNWAYPAPQEESGRFAYRWPLLRMDAEGRIADTLAFLEMESEWKSLPGAEGPVRIWAPFADQPLAELSPDGSGAVFVHRRVAASPTGARFTLGRVNATGDTVQVREFPYSPVPTPDEAVRHHAREIADRSAAASGGAPEVDEIASGLRDSGFVPPYLPPVTRLAPTSDGSVWLRREDAGGESVAWEVFDERLERLARVSLPARFTVTDANEDVVAGFELDQFDVPSVIRYRLLR